jgi:hypothetical protein
MVDLAAMCEELLMLGALVGCEWLETFLDDASEILNKLFFRVLWEPTVQMIYQPWRQYRRVFQLQ